MSEKPIIFNGEMVKAILAGNKTQTRRVIKPQPYIPADPKFGYTAFTPKGSISVRGEFSEGYGEKFIKLKYQVGDVLFVQEEFDLAIGEYGESNIPLYRATSPEWTDEWTEAKLMGKEHSRIKLEITAVRVERVQDISKEDAQLEGLKLLQGGIRTAFRVLWNSIYEEQAWNENPFVFVYTFKVIEGE